MISPAPDNYSSRFFKASQRGSVTMENYKCHSTFNFGNYESEGGQPFGNLHFVNDISIAPNNAVFFNRHEHIQDIILPVSGGFTYNHLQLKKEKVDPEYVLFLEPGSDHACEIQNHHEKEWINYIHIGIRRNSLNSSLKSSSYPIGLTQKDELVSLYVDSVLDQSYGYAAVYNGRTKGAYHLKSRDNGLFAYVLNGAFEVEDRLMEHRDGLSLRNSHTVNFEALSENAILLLLEVPLNNN